MYLSTRGVIFVLAASVLIGGATWIPWLEWAAGGYLLLAGVLLAIDWWQADRVDRFVVNREHDSKLSLGASNPIRLAVRNRHHRPASFWIRDEAPDSFELDTSILEGVVPAQETWHGTYHVTPISRGNYQFGNLNLRWKGPLSLVIRQGSIEMANSVKVYPNLLDIRRFDVLLRRNQLHELGLRSTRLHGGGTEFERLREYSPDDDFKRIDWKATARHHKPITIEFQTERSQNVFLAIDIGRLMRSPVAQIAKLDYVINTSLLLANMATERGDRVGFMTFADDVYHFLSPQSGYRQFQGMLELLYSVQAQPVESDYGRSFAYLAQKQRKRALIVIFTDLSGGLSMGHLVRYVSTLSRHHLPIVVTISDPDIHQAACQSPSDSLSVYQRAAAMQLLDERQVALETLERQGVWTLDVPANRLSTNVIDRYLEIKRRSLL